MIKGQYWYKSSCSSILKPNVYQDLNILYIPTNIIYNEEEQMYYYEEYRMTLPINYEITDNAATDFVFFINEDSKKINNLTNEKVVISKTAIEQSKKYCELTGNVPPPDNGIFVEGVPEWEINHEYKKNDLFSYNGSIGYVKQESLTSQDIYPPFSTGTEALYGARPKPDADGIYPYIYNMGIFEGMRVYGTDGIIYKSISGTYENPTELLYPPEQAVALFVKDGEEIPTEPEEPTEDEYTAWVQPTGAHDAYSIGAKVIYNGKKYISQIEGNTTIPGSDERWWKEIKE